MADRYLLLPSIGLTWLVIELSKYLQTLSAHAWTIFVLWGAALGTFTHERLEVFQGDISLWTDVTKKQPEEVRGWTTLASLYRDNGELQKSYEILNAAERYHVNDPKISLALGMNALSANDLLLAESYFREAWQGNPSLREAGNNLAWVLQKGDIPKSVTIANEVTSIHPLYATGWDTLGNSCLLSADWACAEQAFERALYIEPYRVDTYANLGSLFYLQENWQRAEFWWTKTLVLNPTHTYAQQGLDSIDKLTSKGNPMAP